MTSLYGNEVQEQHYFSFRPQGAGPGVKRSNFFKLQIKCQIQVFLNKSLHTYPLMKVAKHIKRFFRFNRRVVHWGGWGRGHGGVKINIFPNNVVSYIK
jgi:hypothetical protein